MRLVIVGAGFAGMYAALSSARLRDISSVSPERLEIALVAPEPTLVCGPPVPFTGVIKQPTCDAVWAVLANVTVALMRKVPEGRLRVAKVAS